MTKSAADVDAAPFANEESRVGRDAMTALRAGVDASPLGCVIEGPVAWLTLQRPHAMNALDDAMVEALDDALDLIDDEESVRVVVVRATGPAFCTGADLSAITDETGKVDARRLLSFEARAAHVFARIAAQPRPVVAVLNGTTMAGGLELALHCDIVVAASDAEIGDGHIRFGLLPGAGGAARLPRIIGETRAKYLAFTGRLVPAKEAMAMGLVNEVVDSEALDQRASELAHELATRSVSALRLFKQAIDDGLDQPLASALRLERLITAEHLHTGDVQEGLSAFAAKRRPDFS